LSFLSPCILPFLPAFFSYTFKEKTNITKMTFVFFLGFASAFTLVGLIASYLGQSLAMFQGNFEYLIVISGVFLVFFGLMSFFGKGFSSIIKQKSVKRDDAIGIFVFGVLFAVGWTACLGPVLAGILVISVNLNNYFYTAGLMMAYSLGIFFPLLIASVLFDKFKVSKMPLFAGKGVEFKIAGKEIATHSTNMISGIILIAMGVAFIVFKGTGFVNSIDLFGTKMLFYDFQRALLTISFPNFDLYVAVFAVAVVLYFLFGKKIFSSLK
ncbi:MAG: cytochrome c biogenesis protein CcdA, partial [Candidatus Diapherotrites archaeon]|nr:cytochrome c biogenesis protein CcdA [Candidatus Diapherotrites archaeon]